MKKQKGYSLAELLTVVLIVLVLATIALSLMRGRVDSAKWTEGRARAGLIATAIRAWIAGYNMAGSWTNAPGSLDAEMLGFQANEIKGKYFDESNFTWQVDYDGLNLRYVITVTKPVMSWKPDQMVLDTGKWIIGP
jgi:prepilin-type N-terminal cleavage/methylation domain-containing protein